MTQNRTESEIRRLMAEIDRQYQAAQYALSGEALGTSTHAFITARMERIGNCHEQLINLVGDEQEATRLVVEQMNKAADRGGSN